MGAMGNRSRLAIDDGTPDASSQTFEFVSESLAKAGTIIDTGGIRGTRQHTWERTRAGNYTVSGSIELFPTPGELNLLLEWILGGTPVPGTPVGSTTFPLGETLPERFLLIDRVTRRFQYEGVKVSRATFSAREGEALRLSLELVGESETDTSDAFAPTTTEFSEAPFLMTDGALTLAASTRNFKDASIVIDNSLVPQFNNSLTATAIDSEDLNISASFTTPFTADEVDLYNQALAGAAASVVFTNGNYALTFTFGRLQFPAESPIVGGKGEIPLRLNGVARKKVAATAAEALSVVLDLTA